MCHNESFLFVNVPIYIKRTGSNAKINSCQSGIIYCIKRTSKYQSTQHLTNCFLFRAHLLCRIESEKCHWIVLPCLFLVSKNFHFSPGTDAYGHIYKYVDRKGSAAILTSIQSAGVAPEVKLRITQVRKHTSEGSTLALKPRADITRSPKQGYQWSHGKDLCSPKCF